MSKDVTIVHLGNSQQLFSYDSVKNTLVRRRGSGPAGQYTASTTVADIINMGLRGFMKNALDNRDCLQLHTNGRKLYRYREDGGKTIGQLVSEHKSTGAITLSVIGSVREIHFSMWESVDGARVEGSEVAARVNICVTNTLDSLLKAYARATKTDSRKLTARTYKYWNRQCPLNTYIFELMMHNVVDLEVPRKKHTTALSASRQR
ncbi:hypothetical protein H4R18_001157 [Coemansia javaensis]|uniref:Uncharacterized protein n=1 Tax=Coemansia javaensis TaxID=2761396 RepID=A0A9W8LLR6_9FUNG|nr:hypothetical protein H4R18_001157 [Coemansia javaensis]